MRAKRARSPSCFSEASPLQKLRAMVREQAESESQPSVESQPSDAGMSDGDDASALCSMTEDLFAALFKVKMVCYEMKRVCDEAVATATPVAVQQFAGVWRWGGGGGEHYRRYYTIRYKCV
jgi:hypothetical protein